MYFKSIPVVHPRVIELSANARAFAVSIGGTCGTGATRSSWDCGTRPRSQQECGEPEVFAVDPENSTVFGGEPFGVKRPLRFLAYKLQLTEPQVGELAAILDELKIERAQAAVDDRRTHAVFADAVSGERFEQSKASEGATLREKSAERLGAAVIKALGRIHALLTVEQRERFAYLIRTGTIRL